MASGTRQSGLSALSLIPRFPARSHGSQVSRESHVSRDSLLSHECQDSPLSRATLPRSPRVLLGVCRLVVLADWPSAPRHFQKSGHSHFVMHCALFFDMPRFRNSGHRVNSWPVRGLQGIRFFDVASSHASCNPRHLNPSLSITVLQLGCDRPRTLRHDPPTSQESPC